MKTNYKRVFPKRDEDLEVKTISSEELKALLRREVIHTEINANKVSIDRECFKHAFTDKVKLKEAKSSYKKLNDTKEFEEISAKLVNQMLSSTSFDCGELSITYLHELN